METIQERILNVLGARGLMQKDLAASIGVSYSTLNSWLKRDRDIPAQYVIGVCRFLGCSTEYLLTGEEGEEVTQKEDADAITGISDDALRMACLWDNLDEAGKAIILGDIYRRAEAMNIASEKDTGGPFREAK